MASKKPETETIGTAEAARRLNRSKRYTLTLFKAGRIVGGKQLQTGNADYVVDVPKGEAPQCDPPLVKRHKP